MKTKEEILKKYNMVFYDDAPFSQSSAYDSYDVAEAMQEYADQFKPKWVDVTERLPEEGDFIELIDGRVGGYFIVSDGKTRRMGWCDKDGWLITAPYNVKFWMPVPNIPAAPLPEQPDK